MRKPIGSILVCGIVAMTPAISASADTAGRVWKSPTCGCCKSWVEYMRSKGYSLAPTETTNAEIDKVKTAAGVPKKYFGCHSAKIGGYMIEGHVPAADIDRLLREKPDAIGLSVPGMPVGSPGMETDGTVQPFEVHLILKDGTSVVFAQYGKDAKF